MMVRRFAILLVLLGSLSFLSGCSTTAKQKDQEIQGLRNQVSVLEAQIQNKDEEISNLRDSLTRVEQDKETIVKSSAKKKVVPEIKSRPNIKQIQIALKNAGYEPGVIDGRMGRQTKDAIRAFQRANNLSVDGRVGKKTWSLLKDYLYKKVK